MEKDQIEIDLEVDDIQSPSFIPTTIHSPSNNANYKVSNYYTIKDFEKD